MSAALEHQRPQGQRHFRAVTKTAPLCRTDPVPLAYVNRKRGKTASFEPRSVYGERFLAGSWRPVRLIREMYTFSRCLCLFAIPMLFLACSGAPSPGDTSVGIDTGVGMDAPLNRRAALGAASRCVVPAERGMGEFEQVDTTVPTESLPWVVDPDDAMTLYAVGQRTLRSSDGGRTWCVLAWPGRARSLLFTHTPSPALYLAVGDVLTDPTFRVMKSDDGGNNWAQVGSTSSTQSSNSTVHPPSLVLVEHAERPVLLSSRNGEVLRSTDEGSTWEPLNLPPDLGASPHVRSILVSTGPAPVVFAHVRVSQPRPASTLLVSTDAGKTFSSLHPESEFLATLSGLVAVDCHGRVYVSHNRQVYRSSDNGSTWDLFAELEQGVSMFQIAATGSMACGDSIYGFGIQDKVPMWWRFHPDEDVQSGQLPSRGSLMGLEGDRLLLMSADVNRRSDDGGRSWWFAGVPLNHADIVISPARQGRMFAATVHGVARSDDNGRSWQLGAATNGNLFPRRTGGFNALYPDPLDANTVYASSLREPNAPSAFVSHDAGDSFEDWAVPVGQSPEIPKAIAPSATVAGRVTVVTRRGVYQTNNAGKHFTHLLATPATVTIASISAGEPLAIYLSFADEKGGLKLSASLDGGVTWATANAPAPSLRCLLVNPAMHSVAFACPNYLNDGPVLLRTLDGGKTWSTIPTPGREDYLSLSFDPRPPHALYARGKRLYRSDDNGDTWKHLADVPAQASGLLIDPHPGGARYTLGGTGALYRMIEAF